MVRRRRSAAALDRSRFLAKPSVASRAGTLASSRENSAAASVPSHVSMRLTACVSSGPANRTAATCSIRRMANTASATASGHARRGGVA